MDAALEALDRAALWGALPPEPDTAALAAEIRAASREGGRRVVVLDDDPTGVQTMHDIDVLTLWDLPALESALRAPEPLFYILTNSRALSREDAVRRASEIATSLAEAARRTGTTVAVISRSDSTLRGHYPWELEPLRALSGPDGFDGVLIVPAFPEGGRVTVGGVHYVLEGDRYVPAAQTAFARDPSFGYMHSFLPEWVEEKTGGRWRAGEVLRVPIELLRSADVDGVGAILLQARHGRPIVADAAGYADLTVLVAAVLRVEAQGRRLLARTGASFVKARVALADRPLLSRADLLPSGQVAPGLVLVGSYVPRTAEQLSVALEMPGLAAHELSVPRLLGDADGDAHQRELVAWASRTCAGQTALVYTSRDLVASHAGRDHTAIAALVSRAIVRIAASISCRPAWIVAKGGITSSDVATEGLGVRRARVLGQALTGVPVWQLGEETRFPGVPYVVFPGNVGSRDALAELIAMLDPRVRVADSGH
jgi:uncharacterized protein YgbK (DUF1537 family)